VGNATAKTMAPLRFTAVRGRTTVRATAGRGRHLLRMLRIVGHLCIDGLPTI
jgi:hypothetical protein